jgi:hypothetical protein
MTAPSPIRIDATAFPLVVHILDGKQTDADIDAYVRESQKVYQRREPFVAMIHIRDYAMILSHVGRLAAALKRQPQELCKGCAMVVPFPSFRFILSSYYLLHVPPHPVVVFEHASHAEQWARQRLKDLGLRVPEALRAAG